MVAMSGGVDSTVAAAVLAREGHHVVGVTMRLWGGESDTGCCSVADVDDARRVADQLGIDHHVFNFTEDFGRHVVDPYVAAHVAGTTPNPCVECNRRIKFDRLAERAAQLGFDAVATGHHARIEALGGRWALRRSADRAKDQSYVVHMLGQPELARTLFPIGGFPDKASVRRAAADLGLRTAGKPDSQDVCFITSTGGRAEFLRRRTAVHQARVIDTAGHAVGRVDAVELVTLGQRKGLGLAGGGPKRYVVGVDRSSGTVTVGGEHDLLTEELRVGRTTWVDGRFGGEVLVQCAAHGATQPARLRLGDGDGAVVEWRHPQRAVAPGQSVVFYDPTDRYVLGGGVADATVNRRRLASASTAPGRVGETSSASNET
ncbi:MAG: tRNA 2-thiouridine(34) synthase MnmA [Ilumatobacteraceae bacterium]